MTDALGQKRHPSLMQSTQDFLRGQEAINKTTWPTVFALRRLRAAVQRVTSAHGEIDTRAAAEAVADGAEVPYQLDVLRFERTFDVDAQERLIGTMTLLTLMAMFEGALEAAGGALGWTEREYKALMTPPDTDSWLGRTGPALTAPWQRLRDGGSAMIASAYTSAYAQKTHFAPDRLPYLLTGFKYWKEVRNALIHAGGRADHKVLKWQDQYARVRRADLGTRAKVMLTAGGHVAGAPSGAGRLTLNEQLEVTPYAAFNVADLMTKIITTLDFLLTATPEGEQAFIDRLNSAVHRKRWLDPDYRIDVVPHLCRQLSIPAPHGPEAIFEALKARREAV